ncbi:MAG: ParB/RepB/Spo0J family partition protein [Deltaproteobacteria bacterium]|jgi:ParB family chromosome partitioning protein|nr:ParB/RepB/Spo0J family partition protein [Deltaproteobacteria bacterium]
MTRKSTPSNDKNSRKRKKMALGKGLEALIPGGLSAPADDARDYLLCDVAIIKPNRYQPRRHFADEDMADLAASIRAQGVIQPLLVRKDGTGYELVAGERRLRAAKMAGLSQVPVVVKDITHGEMLEMSIVENIQRADFNPIEEADAYHRLMTEFGLTQDQAAERVGKSRSAVANFLRLRQLDDAIQTSIVEGAISMGHARALLGLESVPGRRSAWRTIIAKKLSVRETEQMIRKLKSAPPKPAKRPPNEVDRHLSSLAEDLSRYYGTKVTIQRQKKSGTVAIEFYNDDDLDRLLRLLKNSD